MSERFTGADVIDSSELDQSIMSHQTSGRTPTSPSFLTTIFNSISDLSPVSPPLLHDDRDGLHTLSASDHDTARSLFLTLHMLFPHELLPALDLLDRGLVTRFTITESGLDPDYSRKRARDEVPRPKTNEGAAQESPELQHRSASCSADEALEVFYVLSSSASERSASTARYHSRRGNPVASATFYEVRLDSWNCSCPAFAVASFQRLVLNDHDAGSLDDDGMHDLRNDEPGDGHPWRFGGIAANPDVPAPSCKHILAATLAKVAPQLFGHGVPDKVVSRDELAGWGGGWGELAGG